MRLSEEFPAEALQGARAADLALPLLSRLIRLEETNARLHRGNFSEECRVEYRGDAGPTKILMQAWGMLERQGFVVDRGDGFCFVSDEGRDVASGRNDLPVAFSPTLPRAFLHPELRDGPAWQAFMRGDYEEAVLAAFKALEVTVRARAGLDVDQIGVSLMRAAFQAEDAPLADREVEAGERKACADLFAGAIGMFKNPSSHRYVPYTKADGFHLVLVANHLLSIVEERHGRNAPQAP